MYAEIIASMGTYLSQRETFHRNEARALAEDSRVDEANFQKIRANVFGIFKAVLDTAVKAKGESREALNFFSAKLRDIPASWRSALGSAQSSESALVERLKMQSVSEIERTFRKEMGA